MSDISPDEKKRIFDFIDETRERLPGVINDVKWIKDALKEQRATKKWWITTLLAAGAFVVGAVGALKAWFGGP